jgi:uncharacterized membrane protein YccC
MWAVRNAWEQPVMRLADTIIGMLIGVAASWIVRHTWSRS